MNSSTLNNPATTTTGPSSPARSWKRRAVVGGGVAVGAAAAATLWRAASVGLIPRDDAPFEPWQAWETSPSGDPLSLVAAAILAASPHNTQPWLFHVQDDHIDVHADPFRSLGAMDPFGREMWLGIGAAIANIEIAALARGFAATTELLPAPRHDTLAARIGLRPAKGLSSTLAKVISKRRTHRAAYDPARRVPTVFLNLLSKGDNDDVRLVWLDAKTEPGRAFAQATLAGTQQIVNDADMTADGHHWFRNHPKAVAEHRDGISVPTAGIPPVMAALSSLLPAVDGKTSGQYWLNATRTQLASAPMYGLLAVRDLHDRRGQLLAGARWQRIHLQLTEMGLSAQPMNQLMEIVDRDRQLRRPSPTAESLQRWVGAAGGHATFAFRLGYAAESVPHSPRRPLQAVVKTGGLR